MNEGIAYHGRLLRQDGSAAPAGTYKIRVALHADPVNRRTAWWEDHEGVTVGPDGSFSVLLGRKRPLRPELFEKGERWVSVRVLHPPEPPLTCGPRRPLPGLEVRLRARVERCEQRIAALEKAIGELASRAETREIAETLLNLVRRLDEVEREGLAVHAEQVRRLRERLDGLEGDEGRLDRIEERLGEIDGADGDLVDLVERMEDLERHAPELFARVRSRPDPREVLLPRIEELEARLEGIAHRLEEMAGQEREPGAPAELPDIEALGGVRRTGDTMTGGLVICRGGLRVQSGGIQTRGAQVGTLEATHAVRSPKVIAGAVELRGDLTVDALGRVLQVRMIEGRGGSSRRDGPLHLNTRGGHEVVVGNPETAAGMTVHGPVEAPVIRLDARWVAVRVGAPDGIGPGEVVAWSDTPGRVRRLAEKGDRPAGVVVAEGGVVLGGRPVSRTVLLAIAGLVPVRAVGPVRPGDRLGVTVPDGRLRAVDGGDGAMGTALEGLPEGEGEILMVVR